MNSSRWSRYLVALAFVFVAMVVPKMAFALPLVGFLGTTTDVADIDEAQKIFFTDPIVNNVVTDTELMSIFMEDNNVQTETTTGGRYIETAQYFRLPAGVGFRASNEYIPIPDGPVIANSRVYLKKVQGVVEMTGDVMEKVRGDMGAYLDWMERALPDLLERLNDTVDRALLGYGNGALARIASTWNGVSTTIPIDRAFGVTGWSDAPMQFLEGMRIVASADADGNPLRNPGTGQAPQVTDVDHVNGTITVSALPAAWVVDDFLFTGDDSGVSTQTSGGDDREIMGLAGMVDDGGILPTFQNLARASYRLWQGIEVDGTGAPYNGYLSEELITYADERAFLLGKGKGNLFVTSYPGARSYWYDLKQDRSLNDPVEYRGGKGPLTIQLGDRKIPIKVARKMPRELAYLLQTDTFKRWQIDSGKWDDKTGSIWNRVTDGTGRKDAFYAVYNWYLQTGCMAPRRNARILHSAAGAV